MEKKFTLRDPIGVALRNKYPYKEGPPNHGGVMVENFFGEVMRKEIFDLVYQFVKVFRYERRERVTEPSKHLYVSYPKLVWNFCIWVHFACVVFSSLVEWQSDEVDNNYKLTSSLDTFQTCQVPTACLVKMM